MLHSALLSSSIDCLTTQAWLSSGDPSISGAHPRAATQDQHQGVPVCHAEQLPYRDFVQQFMAPNLPVLIRGVSDHWKSVQDWVTEDGSLNLGFLERLAGSSPVCVTDTCRHHGSDPPVEDMTLSEYLIWWREEQCNSHLSSSRDGPRYYLKDWHFVHEYPQYEAYVNPIYFQEDWLNEYCDMKLASRGGSADREQEPLRAPPEDATAGISSSTTSDYRFVYLGPAGTWTPLHSDVLKSFSWSANICGRKRWRLLPPHLTYLLYDRHQRRMAPDFVLEGIPSELEEHYPGLGVARSCMIEVIQGPGEVLFVPSGWHHTVENLEDTLSINHNWFNAYNVHWVWAYIRRQWELVELAIEDCRALCTADEFEGQVQKNLGANIGLSVGEFVDLLLCIGQRALREFLSDRHCCGGGSDMDNVAGIARDDDYQGTDVAVVRGGVSRVGGSPWDTSCMDLNSRSSGVTAHPNGSLPPRLCRQHLDLSRCHDVLVDVLQVMRSRSWCPTCCAIAPADQRGVHLGGVVSATLSTTSPCLREGQPAGPCEEQLSVRERLCEEGSAWWCCPHRAAPPSYVPRVRNFLSQAQQQLDLCDGLFAS